MNRRCDVCGVEFYAKAHNAKVCGDVCRKAAQRKYQQSPEGKAAKRKYRELPEHKAAQRKREQSPEYKAAKRKRKQSPEYKAAQRKYYENTRAAAQFFATLGMVEAMVGTK